MGFVSFHRSDRLLFLQRNFLSDVRSVSVEKLNGTNRCINTFFCSNPQLEFQLPMRSSTILFVTFVMFAMSALSVDASKAMGGSWKKQMMKSMAKASTTNMTTYHVRAQGFNFRPITEFRIPAYTLLLAHGTRKDMNARQAKKFSFIPSCPRRMSLRTSLGT